MRAAVVERLDGPDSVVVTDVAPPEPGDGVLVDVVTAGVAFPDVLLSRGLYQERPHLPFVLGVECAGVVRDAPDGSGFSPGDHVVGFGMGCLAEQVALPVATALPMPQGMSFVAAGGFVMNYHTAHVALHRRGGLRAGETVLVHGAAGGLGTAVIQLAKGAGARVLATASTEAKRQVAADAGADHTLDVGADWVAAVTELTGGSGVDVVADVVGGDVFDRSVKVLAPESRLLVLGFTSGAIPEVKVNRLLLRNASVVGVGWGPLLAAKPEIGRQVAGDLDRLHREGHVNPLVGEEHPLERVGDALSSIEQRAATGKVMVRVAPDPA